MMNDWSKQYALRKSFHRCFVLLIVFAAIWLIVLKINETSDDFDHGFYNKAVDWNAIEYVGALDDYDPTTFSIVEKSQPWYLENGERYPEPASISNGRHDALLLPLEQLGSDRILNQLMYVPSSYDPKTVKTILMNNGIPYWFGIKGGTQNIGSPPYWWKQKQVDDIFKEHKCPVNACRITDDKAERQSADLVFFLDTYEHTNEPRPVSQLYALHHMENPLATKPFQYPDVFNWTITYRQDSTIVTPYNKWVYYDPRIKQMKQSKNFAANKTKKVAWFVSNCQPWNNRDKYAEELNKHIQVDIYGICGTMQCPRSEEEKCYEMLDKDYKFYLAFENANCKNYITEKFFSAGLGHDVIPIVMGGTPDDYEQRAPLRSYIHVDHFESPKELAEYLHVLDKNDDLYNSYFKWRGTGEFIPNWGYFWCRICALLHDNQTISNHHWYRNINDWWRRPGICANGWNPL